MSPIRISGLTLKANLCIFSIMPFAMNRAIIKACWKSPTKLQGLEALKARKDYWIGGNGLENLNFYGIALGAVSFLIIGIFHPLVIKGEYYFGTKIWLAFLCVGLGASIFSLMIESIFISVALGVFGFASFWGIKEVFKQEQRVKDGHFPKNPQRKYKL